MKSLIELLRKFFISSLDPFHSSRSLVSLGEKQRYLGESAKTQENFNFKNTVGSLKRLIGRPWSDPEVLSKEKKFVNSNLTGGERGEVAASVSLSLWNLKTISYFKIGLLCK